MGTGVFGGILPSRRVLPVHKMTSPFQCRGPESEVPGLVSSDLSLSLAATFARALSASRTLGGATGTSSRPQTRSQPGRTRRGILGFSMQGQGTGGPPLATLSSHQKHSFFPEEDLALSCPAMRVVPHLMLGFSRSAF